MYVLKQVYNIIDYYFEQQGNSKFANMISFGGFHNFKTSIDISINVHTKNKK